MKIIEHGKEQKNVTHQFRCMACGCSFQCNEDEFFENPQVTCGTSLSISYINTKTYITCCPECHKIVKDSEYPSISVTSYNENKDGNQT